MFLLVAKNIFIRGEYLSINWIWWLLGTTIGFVFVFADRIFYSLVLRPNEALGVKIKDQLNQGKVKEGFWTLLLERQEQKELMMRSFLFVATWIILGFLTVTSVSDYFARGFLLGIGTHLIFDFVYDYYYNKDRFDLWFWQIKREIPAQEKRLFLIIASLLYFVIAVRL